MDIAAMSMTLNQSKVQQQASLSVMKMAMGVTATKGDFITSLANETTKAMESSVQPNLGAMLDIRA
ncbi:YjfB family protein [Desulfosporosinus sp. SB140]|uniref:YjfB family protein n=1 Tax=Desulfosporosinus paludis TaxID=3115649 RepID=UPI00388D4F2E